MIKRYPRRSPTIVKPVVAVIFAVILAVAGMWSSRKRPWKGGKNETAVAKGFIFTSLPFILAEAVTGIVSLLTGQLTIPPAIGLGTAADIAILLAGLGVSAVWVLKGGEGKPRA